MAEFDKSNNNFEQDKNGLDNNAKNSAGIKNQRPSNSHFNEQNGTTFSNTMKTQKKVNPNFGQARGSQIQKSNVVGKDLQGQNDNLNNGQNSKGKVASQKKTLSQEDKDRLRKYFKDSIDIKKMKKKYKKPFLFESARPLYKVRRLYTARIAHRLYYEEMREITKLRALASEGGKKGGAMIGIAAKKTRNLLATLLIVFSIMSVVGTGAFVTISMLNKEAPNYDFTGDIVIVDQERIEKPVGSYRLGEDIDVPISIENKTGQIMFLSFEIEMEPNDELEYALDNGELDFSKLELLYNFSDNFVSEDWLVIDNSNNKKQFYYYKDIDINNKVDIIKNYKIDLAYGETNHADWIINGYGVEITFTVEVLSVPSVKEQGLNTVDWPQEWKNKIKNTMHGFKD